MKKYNLIILENQGFCFGVTTAVNEVFKKIPSLPKPVYLLGDLVHNRHVSEKLINNDVIIMRNQTRLEMLDQIDEGSVVISAHGVSDAVYEKIKAKNLTLFDTTCPFVKKATMLIKKYLRLGYDVIYIGKSRHPETEAIESLAHLHLIENEDDIKRLEINNERIAIAHQTTLSLLDIENLHELLKNKYPNLVIINSVCNATKNRQLELISKIESLEGSLGLVIVIGDKMSNNTASLAKRALNYSNITVLKVEKAIDVLVNLDLVKSFSNIIVASGASTPHFIIDEVIDTLKEHLSL